MVAYPYEYALQIWVCTIMSRKTNNEECEENGRCDHCELADLEKKNEAEFYSAEIAQRKAEIDG